MNAVPLEMLKGMYLQKENNAYMKMRTVYVYCGNGLMSQGPPHLAASPAPPALVVGSGWLVLVVRRRSAAHLIFGELGQGGKFVRICAF